MVVSTEYPGQVEYIFSPSCVPLLRCVGCCNDEGLSCAPVAKSNVTMQVGALSPRTPAGTQRQQAPRCPLPSALSALQLEPAPPRPSALWLRLESKICWEGWSGGDGSIVGGISL